jgi:hypothetical protein
VTAPRTNASGIEAAIFWALRRAAEERLDKHAATFHFGPQTFLAFQRSRMSSVVYSPPGCATWAGATFARTAAGNPEVVVLTRGDDQHVRHFMCERFCTPCGNHWTADDTPDLEECPQCTSRQVGWATREWAHWAQAEARIRAALDSVELGLRRTGSQ